MTAPARGRLDELGANVLIEGRRRGPLAMFLAQFRDFMILVLLAGAAISGLVGEDQPANRERNDRQTASESGEPALLVIAAIVLLNAVLGFVQEYRAERAMAALRDHGHAPRRRRRALRARAAALRRRHHRGADDDHRVGERVLPLQPGVPHPIARILEATTDVGGFSVAASRPCVLPRQSARTPCGTLDCRNTPFRPAPAAAA
jgi:hypothetical protein